MKHLLLFAFVMSGLVAAWAVSHSGRTKHLSISKHVARSRLLQLWFGVIVLLATLMGASTLFGWLLPHYGADTPSYWVFILLIVCFVAVATIPHIEGTWRGMIHNIFAWSMVYVILAVMLTVLAWPLSYLSWWIGATIFITSLILVLLSLTKKDLRRWFLYFQGSYLALFFTFLLVVTYL